MGRRTIKRRPAGKPLDGKGFHLADEVRYIQDKAADHDGRMVTIGQLILFSTDTGDAWLLDVTDHLAARLARDGDPEPIHLEDTDTSFAIEWKGQYRIEGAAFIYADRDTGRITTILGYPTQKIADAGCSENFKLCLASVELQSLWLFALWLLCVAFDINRDAVRLLLVTTLFSGFIFLNSFFVWPKLLAAVYITAASAIFLTGVLSHAR